MNIFIRLPNGKHLSVDKSTLSTVSNLKEKVFCEEGIPLENQILISSTQELNYADYIENLEEGSYVDLSVGLMGGVGSSDIPDHLKELAYKYKVYKMICRGCYARLPPNANNCRKRKCGHSANIRPKKKIKDKEGKK
jgi:large subunit ribosomal protein L40e